MTSMYDATVPVVENRPLTGGHFLLSLYSPRQAQATRAGQFVDLAQLADQVLPFPGGPTPFIPFLQEAASVRLDPWSGL